MESLDSLIGEIVRGNLIQSSRRLIFTHCTEEIKARGFYFADVLYSKGGTGVLIKYEEKFFLLTAQHVIKAHYDVPQNESPFFTNALANGQWDSLEKLLYPMRGWSIGSLINTDISWIDDEDIVLVEMGHPMPGGYPEHFLDLDADYGVRIMNKDDFEEELPLLAAGYPIEENLIQPAENGEHGFQTNLNRRIMSGICIMENGFPFIRFLKNYSHEEMNGLSGGIVTSVEFERKQARWAGMIQKAGNGSLRFYPAYAMLPAILSYRKAESFIIDPAANIVNVDFQSTPKAIQGRKKRNAMLKELGALGATREK